jgi:hypothetical protein
MKKIKEFKNVYLEYPETLVIDDSLLLLIKEREELLKTKIFVNDETEELNETIENVRTR